MMTHYRTIDIDGRRIFYREAGSRDLPTLLLLHGFPASSFMFRDLICRLSDRFHVVAPDYPGFGYSDAPSNAEFTYSFDRLADIIERFVDQLGIEKYALYMQDFGGPVGFRLAVRRPEKVTFLIVQNANAYDEGLPDSFWSPVRALWDDPSPENFSRIREAGISDEALEWNYTHGVRDVTKISPDSWVLQSALVNRPGNKEIMLDLLYDYRTNPGLYPEWQAYFRKHQPPTLIVWGQNDVIFPPSGAHPYRRDLEKVDFNLLDTGHFALEEQAEVIAGHIRRFAAAL
ncbi:alpha/beta hydrolase fold protein [Nitratireductor pacificus pht-3B]|uniref:Alpha/beta hydrolase fold protein n=2 Tax=Nitratireductor TaxID=245876 RepID=K2MB52_9HYPH|nr:alpha/beta hydrolase fold protein [Nitratireductor pacificus pht-3B]